MGQAAGEQERVTGIVGFAMGAATGMTVWMLIDGFDRTPRAPSWVALLIVGAVLAASALRPAWRNSRVFLLCAGFLPVTAFGTVADVLDVNKTQTAVFRACGFLVAVTTFFVLGLLFSRRKRELDQLIFREASLFAFFATVFAAVVYGTLAEVIDIPDVSFAALAVFGMGAWMVFLFVFDRRYS